MTEAVMPQAPPATSEKPLSGDDKSQDTQGTPSIQAAFRHAVRFITIFPNKNRRNPPLLSIQRRKTGLFTGL